MKYKSQKILIITVLIIGSVFSSFAKNDYTKYIDPTIGNVAQFLVPTYPTMHLPNQMIRMFPVKTDYISDQVTAFPLQVVSHRSAGIFQMRVSLGEITSPFITHNQIMMGGTLELVLDELPNKEWGIDAQIPK